MKQDNTIYNNHYSDNNLNYILLDLRVSMEGSNDKHYDVKPGFLPMTVILDQDDFKDPYVIIKLYILLNFFAIIFMCLADSKIVDP